MTGNLAIVTGEDAPNLTQDGRLLAEAFRDAGFAADPVVWTDSGVDWTAFDVALLRSCWKYYARLDEFRNWLDAVESADVTILNPPDVVRWNLHKSYLTDLEAEGVPVVPTEFVRRDGDRRLESILRNRGWEEAVVKPAVGTSAAGVWKTSAETAGDEQDRFEARFPAARRSGDAASTASDGDQRLSKRGALVQEFVPAVADGERSLVFFAGEFSHAWRSLRAPEELGVDADFDETERYDPSPGVRQRAADAIRAAGGILDVDPTALPYARVDCVVRDGEFRLMELELVEPYLNLGRKEDAVETFTTAVESALGR